MNLQSTFQKFNQSQKAQGPWGLIRQNGYRYFETHGLPTKQDEAWKYTSLKSLPEDLLQPQDFSQISVPQSFEKDLEVYLNPSFFHLVFLNGALVEKASELSELKEIKVFGLEEVEE